MYVTVTQNRSWEARLPKEFLGYFKLQCNASQLLGALNFTLKIEYKVIISLRHCITFRLVSISLSSC